MKLKFEQVEGQDSFYIKAEGEDFALAYGVDARLANWIVEKVKQEAVLDSALLGLHSLLCDEDLDDEKLQEASEGLLPNILDDLQKTKVLFGSPLVGQPEIEMQ